MTGASPEIETPPSPGAAAAPDQDALATINAGARGTLVERMGIEIVELSPERAVATMPVEGNTQPYGLLHGGASCVLAETLGSVAAAMSAGEGRVAVGVDINATHHRAVRTGVVRAVCMPLRVGRAVASYEIVISDEQDRRVCTARLTCVLRDAAPE